MRCYFRSSVIACKERFWLMEANQWYECDSMASNGHAMAMAPFVTSPVFSILSFSDWAGPTIPCHEFPMQKYIGPWDPSFSGCYGNNDSRAIFVSPCFLNTNAPHIPSYTFNSSIGPGSVLTHCFSLVSPRPIEPDMQHAFSSIGPHSQYLIENMLVSPLAEIKSSEGLESINVSESGWTMYLDQSLRNSNNFTSNANEYACNEEKSVMADEDQDSSMVSDASSGPEQPLETQQCLGGSSSTEKMEDTAIKDSRWLRLPHTPETKRSAKRRKVEADHEQNLFLLEDTASSPVCSSKSGLTENKLRVKEILELSKGVSDSHEADAVNTRLDLLQSILPENTTTPICREETLGVTMEYINSLEQRIKVYREKPAEEDEEEAMVMLSSGRDEGLDGESCGALRKRGLCLVPLSTLWSSI